MSLLRQSSSMSNNSNSNTGTVAIGIDLGTCNARIAIYDDTLQHPVIVSNRDGHRTTTVELIESENNNNNNNDGGDVMDGEDVDNTNGNNTNANDPKQEFYERLVDLAADAAHTKDLHVVVSVPNHYKESNFIQEWMTIILKDKIYNARVITEAAAICLAYDEDNNNNSNNGEGNNNNGDSTNTSTTTTTTTTILVIDGGASGIKATIVAQDNTGSSNGTGSSAGSTGLYKIIQPQKLLASVNGNSLLEPLAQYVAQQFEMKHRFPRGEIWSSKKARMKLMDACQVGLKTLYINNSSVTIHVDGLYEGIDYQCLISKPKWEHLSGKLVRETKTFLSQYTTSDSINIDKILLSGGLYTWLTPIVKSIFDTNANGSSKVVSNTSYFDPSEAIAMGCCKQANYHLTMVDTIDDTDDFMMTPTLDVPISPVSIGVGLLPLENETDTNENTTTPSANGDTKQQSKLCLIEKGTPLPVMVTQNYESLFNAATSSSLSCLELWQFEPTPKPLCKIEELTESSILKLQLTIEGQLRVWVDGETLVF